MIGRDSQAIGYNFNMCIPEREREYNSVDVMGSNFTYGIKSIYHLVCHSFLRNGVTTR